MVNRRKDAYRFHIALIGIAPPIWREILVPARYSFWDLHVAIQDAMGWLDYHMHEFTVMPEGPQGPEGQQAFGIPTRDDLLEHPVQPGWEHAIADHLSQPGTTLRYVYDFGDDWWHSVRLVAVEPRQTNVKYPQCTGGKRACPPEDCGGVPGYQELVHALLNPDDPEFEHMNEWIPEGWTPEAFKPAQVVFDNPTVRWRRAFGGG